MTESQAYRRYLTRQARETIRLAQQMLNGIRPDDPLVQAQRRAVLESSAYVICDHMRAKPRPQVSKKKITTTGAPHGRLHSPDATHRHGVVR